MDKIKGYVYILTNKSFRDDWVKIGKSSRPVDVRIDPSRKAQRPLYGSIPRSTSSNIQPCAVKPEYHAVCRDVGVGVFIGVSSFFCFHCLFGLFLHYLGLAEPGG